MASGYFDSWRDVIRQEVSNIFGPVIRAIRDPDLTHEELNRRVDQILGEWTGSDAAMSLPGSLRHYFEEPPPAGPPEGTYVRVNYRSINVTHKWHLATGGNYWGTDTTWYIIGARCGTRSLRVHRKRDADGQSSFDMSTIEVDAGERLVEDTCQKCSR